MPQMQIFSPAQCKSYPRITAGCVDRLVHRLDRETSGALAVARTPDAAAWLSACFREHAESAAGAAAAARPPREPLQASRPAPGWQATAGRGRVDREQRGRVLRQAGRPDGRGGNSVAASAPSFAAATGGGAVRRTYWAIVEVGDLPGGALPASGRIDAAIWGGSGDSSGGDDPSTGGGAWRPAATAFSVLQQGGGYAWLELQPETGVCCHVCPVTEAPLQWCRDEKIEG